MKLCATTDNRKEDDYCAVFVFMTLKKYAMPLTHNCTLCNATADLLCSRCYAPYCSTACQIKNWVEHKRDCKQIPELIKISTLFKGVAADTGKSEVYDVDGTLTRDKNLEPVISEKNITKEVINSMRSLKTREFSSDFDIDGVNIVTTKKHVDKHAKLTLTNKSPKEKQQNNEIEPEIERATDVEKKISKHFTMDDIDLIKIRIGENIPLIITDTSFLKDFIIAVMDYEAKDRGELSKHLTNLSRYCEKAEKQNEGYDPQINELCLAVFDEDGQWYRAIRIPERNGEKYKVQFIDYGNVGQVERAKIMPITKELLFPLCTNYVRILNLKECDLKKFKAHANEVSLIKGNIRYNKTNDEFEVFLNNLELIFNKRNN